MLGLSWVVVQSAKPVGSECGLTESVAGREWGEFFLAPFVFFCGVAD